MGIGVIIFGCIECPGWTGGPSGTACKRLNRWNRRIISQLPESDSEWPFLTKGMFSVSPARTSLKRHIPQYEHQLIHFAAEYKNMVILEADWITKFERLLGQLCWYNAHVTIDFSRSRYEWTVPLVDGSEFSGQIDGYFEDPPRPPKKWRFECFNVEYQPRPAHELINTGLARYRRLGDPPKS